jgi:hypothetical protein
MKGGEMYTLVRYLRSARVTVREAATLGASIVIAELFYKFHSFSLECLAFLATWTVLSGVIEGGEHLLLRGDARDRDS